MKNVIFMLAFMLFGISSFAWTDESTSINKEITLKKQFIKLKDANVLKKEKETFFFLVSYYCSVEDGHFRGEGHGRTSRQACRRARRDLRRQARQ